MGIVTRGLVDLEVTNFWVSPGENERLSVAMNECHVCYALGDTLREEDGRWHVRFVAIFRSAGEIAEIRLSDKSSPPRQPS